MASPGGAAELPAYLQCVPYARERSGVQIFGDARTWWDQAEGRYKRGNRPRPGAVMTFRPYGAMTLGHVAAVSRVIDNRTVLLDHANWSPIDGRRGQIERGVKAIDVSPANDWSQVRVWYAPLNDIGTTAWPVAGFIYNEPDGGAPLGGDRVLVNATYSPSAPAQPSKAFSDAFAGLGEPRTAAPRPVRQATPPAIRDSRPRVVAAASVKPRDPIDAAIARYGS
ncbi:CHAP domain-containing protein [Tsuneonella sp. YG55]|uniref:CHAP domain-containing protein n=2 Tax=Tsuneonella litorea TaxID=2976475 RepID=A0A9X2W0Q4_9SPHN|nr:CHAP domain-containing protein [Tsuneonella litorea]MCT2558897.1 CHAP domain-containing protein [Tsuneonella litorea]